MIDVVVIGDFTFGVEEFWMAAIDPIAVIAIAAIAKREAVGNNFIRLIELLSGSVSYTESTLDRIHCSAFVLRI